MRWIWVPFQKRILFSSSNTYLQTFELLSVRPFVPSGPYVRHHYPRSHCCSASLNYRQMRPVSLFPGTPHALIYINYFCSLFFTEIWTSPTAVRRKWQADICQTRKRLKVVRVLSKFKLDEDSRTVGSDYQIVYKLFQRATARYEKQELQDEARAFAQQADILRVETEATRLWAEQTSNQIDNIENTL